MANSHQHRQYQPQIPRRPENANFGPFWPKNGSRVSRIIFSVSSRGVAILAPSGGPPPGSATIGPILGHVLSLTVFGHFGPKYGTPSSGIISTTFWPHEIIQVDIRRLLKFQPIPVPFATSSEFFCVPVSPFWTIFQTVFSGGKKIFP